MPVPAVQSLKLPILKALSDGEAKSSVDIRELVAAELNLTHEEKAERYPTGHRSKYNTRIAFALIQLDRVELVDQVRPHVFKITGKGSAFLKDGGSRESSVEHDAVAPEEAMALAEEQNRDYLRNEILERVRRAPPNFVEQLVFDLLIAMGYGGGDRENGQVVGRSNDGGLDVVISEDTLGLNQVYVQVKRYKKGNNIGAGHLRDFAGALDQFGARKGVFLTTSDFTRPAKKYVRQSPKRIVTIAAERLADLMIKHNVGVREVATYLVKRIDEDYFE